MRSPVAEANDLALYGADGPVPGLGLPVCHPESNSKRNDLFFSCQGLGRRNGRNEDPGADKKHRQRDVRPGNCMSVHVLLRSQGCQPASGCTTI